jgi:aerobactin synthase
MRFDATREDARVAGARRVAQALGELCFEGLLTCEQAGEGIYEMRLGAAMYRFRGRASAWGGVHVEVGSVTRRVGETEASVESPIDLLLDARGELGASEEVLAEWFAEIHGSLLAEAEQVRRLRELDAGRVAELSGVALEQHLDGHPKLIAHRGRIGWGLDDLRAYAPECGARVRMHWLAVAPELARCSGAAPGLLAECCDVGEQERLTARLHAVAPGLADAVLVPVHPWQWQRQIAAHYGRELARGEVVSLGEFGDLYAPRMSVRTLANVERPARADLKVSLTIMNTSCWRGLPAEHVEAGAAVGAALRRRVEGDASLRAADLRVLCDLGGVHVPQREFAALAGAPYRVRELLAAIWRESARLGPGELEVPAAALQQRDLAGAPVIRAWVERSGVSLVDWLAALFDRTAVPLYHLLCAHGLGAIAHGQNLGLVLRDGLPVASLLRDVHGDLRRLDDPSLDHEPALRGLKAMPGEQIVHDLYTGYFVGVLRFVAPLLEAAFGLRERAMLSQLAGALRRYQDEHPRLHARFAAMDLFRPTMVRICLNRARLRAGHGGGAVRPLPELGPPLRNPLIEESHDHDAR